MKKIRLAALLLTGVVSLSHIVTASADTGVSDIKRYILLEKEYSGGTSVYDINKNGKVDVFDVCRIKQQMVSEKTEKPSLMTVGEPFFDYDKGFMYVPLNIKSSGFDVAGIRLTINHDPSAFTLDYLEGGDFPSEWRWAPNKKTGQTYMEFSHSSDLRNGGTIVVARFNILPGTYAGVYDLSFTNISMSVNESGKTRELSEEECPSKSEVFRIPVNTYDPPVTTPPVTEPPVTTAPDVSLPVSPDLEPGKVYEAMIALKKQYPEGMSWTNDNSYEWNGGIYWKGYGCAGFAFLLSDAAFGTLPARIIKEYDPGSIRTGDILRVNNDGHSVVVLETNDNGVVIAEGNYNNSIHWGRVISWSELENTFTYLMTRYPE
ncbi:MAG: hypothetical protein E7505_08405 [Ruminococcus sp.]|nr:hypothetical protein [Ruminococcus sp.]